MKRLTTVKLTEEQLRAIRLKYGSLAQFIRVSIYCLLDESLLLPEESERAAYMLKLLK